jgi:hypothetical protein
MVKVVDELKEKVAEIDGKREELRLVLIGRFKKGNSNSRSLLDKGFAKPIFAEFQTRKDTILFIRNAIFAAAFSLISAVPARSAVLTDYFRSAKDFQAGADYILGHTGIHEVAALHKVHFGETIRNARLKRIKLVSEKAMSRAGLKTIKGYRLYKTTYQVGSKTYKGYIYLALSYELKDDAQRNGRWVPHLGFYSVAFKGDEYDPGKVIAAKCGDYGK